MLTPPPHPPLPWGDCVTKVHCSTTLVHYFFYIHFTKPTSISTHLRTQRKLLPRYVNIVHTHWIHAGIPSLRFVSLVKHKHVDSTFFLKPFWSSGVFIKILFITCPWHVIKNMLSGRIITEENWYRWDKLVNRKDKLVYCLDELVHCRDNMIFQISLTNHISLRVNNMFRPLEQTRHYMGGMCDSDIARLIALWLVSNVSVRIGHFCNM